MNKIIICILLTLFCIHVQDFQPTDDESGDVPYNGTEISVDHIEIL
jgi:hypothetical protein